jgi:predicted O-linked N-acetylglucosamine transferase (SPINDLY family)
MGSCSPETIQKVDRLLHEACGPYEQGDVEAAWTALDQAAGILQDSASLGPDDLGLWWSFGRHVASMRVFPERLESLVRLLKVHPWGAALHSDLLTGLHFLPDLDPVAVARQHRRWARLHAPVHLARGHPDPDRDPNRRLRIGYLSADFRAHCVAFFFEPLLDGHDRDHFEILGYGNVPPAHEDLVTQRLVSKFDRYRSLWGVDDLQAGQWIADDQVDILVDLGGHTHHNRLPVLAYRPAPVQVTYLGYPNTTGLSQIDYRITDAIADLPEARRLYTERLVALDTCFAAYRPFEDAPDVEPPPVMRKGRITFGSFTGTAKHSSITLGLWAEVLKANPGSELLLRFEGADEDCIQQRTRRVLAGLGVEPSRILFDGFRRLAEHLGMYNQVDIGLDTYPWSSHTTLCEALWMGVPVVSLTGRTFVSRTGASVLSRVGLESLAVTSGQEYVTRATALARDIDALSRLRLGLRESVRSGLCDPRRQALAIEEAFRSMWYRGCQATTRGLSAISYRLSAGR